MKDLIQRIAEWWMTFRYGPPCPKHLGHRQRELDMELETGYAMAGPDMCSACWQEEKETWTT